MSSDASGAASLAERASKLIVIVALCAAIPLHLAVDPAGGWAMRILTIALALAGFVAARRWPAGTPAVMTTLLPLGPALLTAVLHVAALNVFYTALLTGLFASLLPRIPFDRWVLPASWRLPLAIWGLTLALGWPVMIVREAGLRLRTLLDIGALDSWTLLTTPQVESWILFVVITQLVALFWLEWLFVQGSGIRDQGSRALPFHVLDPRSPIPGPPPLAAHGLWIGATLASVVAIYQGTVNIAFLSGGVWPGLRRAAGTLLDANAYGTVAAFAGPIAFVSIPYLGLRHARPAQAAALAINWAGAWMSGSRTAFVCGALGTVLLVYELLRATRRSEGRRRETSSLLAGIAAVVLVLITVTGAIGPFRRMVSTASADAAVTDLWSRGGYGTVATRMIRDYPVTGVGIGSFNWMAADYWRLMANERLPFDNAQNWWRHQVVELGILGALPVVLWSLLVAWLVLTRPRPPDNRIEAQTLRGLLIGLGIASLLGVPTQNPIVLLIFFYLVARFENLTNPRTPNPRTPNPEPRIPDPGSRIPSGAWIAGALIAIIYASGQLVLARGPLKPLARAERTNRDYIIGTYPGEPLPQGSFRWTRKRATFALAAPSRYLVIRFHVEHPDVGTHPVKVRISTRCQTLVDEFRTDGGVDARAFEIPPDQSRILFDTDVSRTWRPSDFGKADRRELGMAVEADFVGTPTVVSSQDRWIPLKPCDRPTSNFTLHTSHFELRTYFELRPSTFDLRTSSRSGQQHARHDRHVDAELVDDAEDERDGEDHGRRTQQPGVAAGPPAREVQPVEQKGCKDAQPDNPDARAWIGDERPRDAADAPFDRHRVEDAAARQVKQHPQDGRHAHGDGDERGREGAAAHRRPGCAEPPDDSAELGRLTRGRADGRRNERRHALTRARRRHEHRREQHVEVVGWKLVRMVERDDEAEREHGERRQDGRIRRMPRDVPAEREEHRERAGNAQAEVGRDGG
jgi:O-antigen ligase